MVDELKEKRIKLLGKLKKIINEKLSKKEALLVHEFVNQYYLSISNEDLVSKDVNDIFSSLISQWNFISNRKKNQTKIKIFNPSIKRDNWESEHTIIELVCDHLPFLINSIRMELNRLELDIHLMVYIDGFVVEREKDDNICKIISHTDSNLNKKNIVYSEIPLYIEIDKISNQRLLNDIKSKLLEIVSDVRLSFTDWGKMQELLSVTITSLEKKSINLTKEDFEESKLFLKWLLDNNFVFLGSCDYKLIKQNKKYKFETIKNSMLGISKKKNYLNLCHLCDLPESAQDFYLSNSLIVTDKLNIVSKIHRPGYLDYISIKLYDAKGKITKERCFVGLYTARVYNSCVTNIPLIRKKIASILNLSGFAPDSIDTKSLINIIENLPRDDVFNATASQLQQIIIGVHHLQERQIVKLFVRRDIFGRYFSCFVFSPRESFNSNLRKQYQDILLKELQGDLISFSTKFSDSMLARIHFIVRIDPYKNINYDAFAIEKQLRFIAVTWKDSLKKELIEEYKEEKGNLLLKQYVNSFPEGYKEYFTTQDAVLDINHIEQTILDKTLSMRIYYIKDDVDDVFRFKLFHLNKPMSLFEVVPILENLGLKIISENPYRIIKNDGCVAWINDYKMLCESDKCLSPLIVKDIFQQAFRAIWYKKAENDVFNKLILTANLTWREVSLLRAYYKYLWQINAGYSLNFVAEALTLNSNIAQKLVNLFYGRFNPNENVKEAQLFKLKEEIELNLEDVDVLAHDTIIRKYVNLIFATVRTNYFQYEHDIFSKDLTKKLTRSQIQYNEIMSVEKNSRNIGNFSIKSGLYERNILRSNNPSLNILQFNVIDENSENEINSLPQKIDVSKNSIVSKKYLINYHQDKIFNNKKSILFKEYLSFKFESDKISNLPLPKPKYEIFCYSPQYEGIHLRAAQVARGGIRWSNRIEDYRTEVLSLMKTQQVKNSLIVPHGAKGGFVVKNINENLNPEESLKQITNSYKNFIKSLLDLTDNRIKNKIYYPKKVKHYDGHDPYLVVAADRGTASFSDIANEISNDYNFWLKDAFASGGKTGYDHKKMGITAKGAWESVVSHFRDKNIDINRPFKVIGIGSMTGDVFGNGMLLSQNIKLVACFNHSHIFIDPSPIPEQSYLERKRIFNLKSSNWTNYNTNLISKGGGIFSRKEKYIKLSTQAKQLLNIDVDKITPNDLIKSILKAKVDLLWNGGIGTFVKASFESNNDVGDKYNDAIRIDAKDLNVSVVVEGGNLGFTQLGRIEFAMCSGKINTDSIDNSGGVNCSDMEVNIKILLNDLLDSKKLTTYNRNKLLQKMSNEITNIVLDNNKKQNIAISIIEFQAKKNIRMHNRLITMLEKHANLNRKVEFLPNKNEIIKRKKLGLGLTRPEIAVVLAYTKIYLQNELINSDFPENHYFNKYLENYFPDPLRKKYTKYMQSHTLKREIIVTQVSNLVVNEMGMSFINRLKDETGANISIIVCSYFVVREIFDYKVLFERLIKLRDNDVIESDLIFTIIQKLNRLMRQSTRWFLKNKKYHSDIQFNINLFKSKIDKLYKELTKSLRNVMLENTISYKNKLIEKNIPKNIADKVSKLLVPFSSLDIVDTVLDNNINLIEFTRVYFLVGDKLYLDKFKEKVNEQIISDHWDSLARVSFIDDIDAFQKDITAAIIRFKKDNSSNLDNLSSLNNSSNSIVSNLKSSDDFEKLVSKWICEHKLILKRWKKLVTEIESSKIEMSMITVAIRELFNISFQLK